MNDAQLPDRDLSPRVVFLRDMAPKSPGITRLGPPPGDRELLIRGGLGELFGIRERPLDAVSEKKIVRLEPPPDREQVLWAFWREMAWRRVCGDASLTSPVKHPRDKRERLVQLPLSYVEFERMFVARAATLLPGMSALPPVEAPMKQGKSLAFEAAKIATCACGTDDTCCAVGCRDCSKGGDDHGLR